MDVNALFPILVPFFYIDTMSVKKVSVEYSSYAIECLCFQNKVEMECCPKFADFLGQKQIKSRSHLLSQRHNK